MAHTLETAPQPLVEAVQSTIAAVDAWNLEDGQWIAESTAGVALNALTALAFSEFPRDNNLVDLYLTVVDLGKEWTAFTAGKSMTEDGEPPDSFWEAYAALSRMLQRTEDKKIRPLESVAQLWKELEGFPRRAEQIAQMYGKRIKTVTGGERWEGPFFKGGIVDAALVEKEALSPHSVLDVDFVPPAEQEKRAEAAQRAAEQLKNLHLYQQKKRPKVDPLQMLAEGQFADVVARVAGMSERDLRVMAAREGVAINERDLSPTGISSADPVAEARGYVQPKSEAIEVEPIADDKPAVKLSGDTLRATLAEMLVENSELTVPEIMTGLAGRNESAGLPEVRKLLKELRG